VVATLGALGVVTPACGKKGPPLPPLVPVPDAVRDMTARRVGSDVFVKLTLPARNVDTSTPVNLGRVELYGYTGLSAPPPTRFTTVAALVGTVEPPAQTGEVATLRDTLMPDELVPGPAPARVGGPGGPAIPGTAVPTADARGSMKRFYMAIAFSDRGRPGPPSPVIELPLTPVPDAPLEVRAAYTADAVILTWEPSGGVVGFLLDRALPPAASPLDDPPLVGREGTLPVGPTTYNVYRETAPDPSAPPVAESAPMAAPPVPLNPTPIASFGFTDALRIDGRQRCYTVTAVRGTGDRAIEGGPSAPACVTPVDTFPPTPPAGVSPIASDGEISLVWEANSEPDLRGYVVLRGEAGDATLTPVTDQVVQETRFTDRSVRPGVTYVYAVTAVDTRLPQPNVSAESERVEVTAR
jgi:hypothetical protein